MLGQPSSVPGFEVALHRSLTEPILLAGAPRSFAILNGTLAVWVTRKDPAFLTVLSRHARHKGALTC